ncbi:MAG: DegV family protein, partial [Actinobacteria bacterium]|nr:DegV family protein [Actinomycetota bacterium]
MTVRIVTDSACDLPQEMADSLGIRIVPLSVRFGDTEYIDRETITTSEFWIVPLSVRFGDTEYIDRETITTSEFWKLCAASPTLPETAAPSQGKFEEYYRSLKAEGATAIVVVSLSSDLSATMQSAVLAARALEPEIPVVVVDSRSASMGQGLTVLECAEMARAGATQQEIVARAEQLALRTHVVAALDTLDNLKKGGRIGGAKAMMASALSIKPLIEIRDGKVEEAGRQRTRSKALA